MRIDDYIDSYDLDSRKGCFGCIVPILLIIAIIIGIFSFVSYNSEKEYTVTVTDKIVKNYDDDSKYLIFTEDGEGNTQTYEIEDTWLRFRWDSSDMYGKLKVGEKYNIKTIGWRVQFFSWYENIISAEVVE